MNQFIFPANIEKGQVIKNIRTGQRFMVMETHPDTAIIQIDDRHHSWLWRAWYYVACFLHLRKEEFADIRTDDPLIVIGHFTPESERGR